MNGREALAHRLQTITIDALAEGVERIMTRRSDCIISASGVRRRKRSARLLEQELCVRCAQPQEEGYKMCGDCRAKDRTRRTWRVA